MRRLRKGQKCEWDGCDEIAVFISCGRTNHKDVGVYCMEHSLDVEEENSPEYIVSCPNCDCSFGVN